MFKLVVLCALVVCVFAIDSRIDPNGSWRVVGGSSVPNANTFPIIVSIRASGNGYFCVGTILNSVNILTAAQCIIGRLVTNTNVVAGSHLLNSGGQARGSSRLFVHASYNQNTLANDIGVIRLSSALAMGGTTQRVPLNTANTGAVAAIAIGWGRTSTNGPYPNNLQQVPTQTLTHANCRSAWGNSVTPSHICALTGTGAGACFGDSGGPLLQNSNRAQLGVLSFTSPSGCAIGRPDVYTRVSSYINWISSAVYL